MDEKQRTDEFLECFKEIEKIIVRLADKKDDDYVSFSRALNTVYYQKKNAVICNEENYSFLRSASDLRNILSHENDVCAPSINFLNKTKSILVKLTNENSVYDACTKKIVSCSLTENYLFVMKKMEENGLSHLPILYKGMVNGVFSRSTIFDYLSDGMKLSDDLVIKDFASVTDFNKHHNETFLFVSKNTSISKVFSYLSKREPHKKNVVCLFVTENGKKDERLLGICTMSDLTSFYIKNEF